MGMYLDGSWPIFLAINVTADSSIIVDHRNQRSHKSGKGKDVVVKGAVAPKEPMAYARL